MMNIIGYGAIIAVQIICIMAQFTALCIIFGQPAGLVRDTKFMTACCGIGVMIGYILIIQSTTVDSLLMAHKVYYGGISMMPVFFLFAVHALFHRPIRKWVAISVFAIAICELSFIYMDGLTYFLYSNARMAQNQTFYYLETEQSALYYVFHFYMLLLLTSNVYVILRERYRRIKEGRYDNASRKLSLKLLLIVIMQLLAFVVYEGALLNHYDIASITISVGVAMLTAMKPVPGLTSKNG